MSESTSQLLDRRQFLRVSAMAAAGTVVAACSGGGGSSGGSASTGGAINGQFRITKTDIEYASDIPFNGTLKEAPTLAALVKQGKLPPVDQRVPKPPYVMPHEWLTEGKYGGQMTWVCSDPTDQQTANNLVNAQYAHSPLRWLHDGAEIGPYMVHSWSTNSDLSQWTFHFRQGLKWSDGQPWSVDDILYFWEDEIGVLPGWTPSQELRSSKGTPVKMVKVDDVTLQFQYDAPTPLAANYVAMWAKRGFSLSATVPNPIGPQMMDPKHYLSQFHIKYNPSLNPSTWSTTYQQKMDWLRNPDNPSMAPWKCKSAVQGQYITMERNPYYWGIDKWGNQLPFMDQITNQNYQDPQSMRLAIQQGKADYVSGDQIGITLADVQNLQNTPGMELFYWDSGDGTGSMYFFNYDYEDAKLRALFRNPVFRQAMSLAWNRENARKVIYFEQGELTAGTMSPKAVEFHVGTGPALYQQWRTNFLSYDPKKAGQMLDSIGVKKVGQWRTMPDGSPLQITLNYAANATNDHVQKNDLLSKDWQAIGINADPSPVPPDSRLALWAAGKLQMYCDWGVGDGPNCLTYANWIVPTDPQRWAPLEGEWFLLQGTAQANAQPNVDPWSRTPPNLQPDAGGPVDRIQKLYLAAPLETDFMKRNQSVWNIMKIHLSDGPFFSGCVSNYPLVHMRKTDMKNIPRRDQTWLGGFDGPWTIVPNGMYDPSTWFWSDPTKHPVT